MRTLLVTGPGGAGRTTLAAATALTAAREGTRTLLISADRQDTLGAALGTPTGPRPKEVEPGLTAVRPDPDTGFRTGLLALQEHARPALDLLGAGRLDDEELTPLPGADDLALLGALGAAAHTQTYDTVVVDLPAAPGALALLALPGQLRRYLRRLLPPERQAARALRPVLGRLAGVPVPAGSLYEAAARWEERLAAAQAVIEAPGTSVRLVAEPGPAGADAVARTATGLALGALALDAVVANRVLPTPHDDSPWLAALRAQQHKTLAEWTQTYPTHEVTHRGQDPRGTDDLAALRAPAPGPAPDPVDWPVTDTLATDSLLIWSVPLPGVVREDLDLIRRGDELVVTAGPFRRIVTLPSALRRCAVTGAGLREGTLRIRFAPDPDLWPQNR
ncbi:ArsA-related P-loop ATPase [Streptomyces lasiicapitis]|uniref:ArsA family ATPase n=1 Tax=Streptomyces lasiicapitis TaxID=1923961 RepID=UPI00331F163E